MRFCLRLMMWLRASLTLRGSDTGAVVDSRMLNSTTYEVVANAFTVVDIARPIELQAHPSEIGNAVLERLFEFLPDDQICLVRDDRQIHGWLDYYAHCEEDQITEQVGSIASPISPDQIVSASMPILVLLPLFEIHHFFFVLTRNEITHTVSFNDMDSLPTKLCIFSLFMELENQMTMLLKEDITISLRYLSESRLEKARQLCTVKYKNETEDRLLLCTTFIDKANMFQRHWALAESLPFPSKREGQTFFTIVERMRNQIAHGDSIFNVLDTPASLNDFIALVRGLIAWISDPG